MSGTRNLSILTALGLIALCSCAFPQRPRGNTPEREERATMGTHNPKKGVGHWGTGKGENHPDPAVIDELGCGWFYTWRPSPKPGEAELRAEFIPMIWDEKDVTDEVLARVKVGGYAALLGFNEPDNKGQADMTVAEAIELWPKLMDTGLRLGSPGTCQGAKWLDDFMAECARRDYRVDVLCLHWYDDITKPDAVDNLRRYLTRYWEKYRLPIWLTEYSGADWRWCESGPVTFETNARFARESVAMLESLPFVERYAWFSTSVTPKDRIYPTTGLYHTTDSITVVGEAYRDAD